MRLVGVERDVPFGEGIEQAREIIAAQIAPVAEPLVSAVPPGTTLRALFLTERGEAYVDLSRELTAAHSGGAVDELLTVYTIVDALTVNLPAVESVQMLVDGKEVQTLAGHVDLRQPLAKNLSLGTIAPTNHAIRQAVPDQLRPTNITPNFMPHAEGSVLIEAGRTRVICTASIEDRVPPFLRNTGKGWVTAEYGMLPRATSTRTQREASAGKVGGRTQEIQRLIGRSLRAVTKLPALGERTIWIDCDVIQADGGTRTASITGAFVALALALETLRARDVLRTIPLSDYVAATSVGIVDGEALLDLAYEDDSRAEVDMNIVKTGDGRFIEVQGTAEAIPFGATRWRRCSTSPTAASGSSSTSSARSSGTSSPSERRWAPDSRHWAPCPKPKAQSPEPRA